MTAFLKEHAKYVTLNKSVLFHLRIYRQQREKMTFAGDPTQGLGITDSNDLHTLVDLIASNVNSPSAFFINIAAIKFVYAIEILNILV